MSRRLLLAALIAVAALIAARPAPAATGDLTYRGCISADSDVGPGGSGACAATENASPGGGGTGLDLPRSVAISRDGRNVYASGADDAVVVFDRDPGSGQLSYNSCLTGDSGLAACSKTSTATPGGDDSGLGNLGAIAIGPDDENLYVVSQDDYAVSRLQRNPATGALTFAGCISGRATTTGICLQSPTASGSGGSSGFQDLQALALSRDGSSLYAVSSVDDAVLRLARSSAGALSWGNCLSADTGVGGCVQIPGASASGAGSGLDSAAGVAVSPDGRHVYVIGAGDDAIARFARNTQSGFISFAGCLSAETQSAGACAQFPGAASAGSNTGFDRPTALSLSPDGENLYVSSRDDDAITTLNRNPASGALSWAGCLSGEFESGGCSQVPSAFPAGANSGLDRLLSVTVSDDGQSLYAAAHFDDGVVTFDRNLNGAITYVGCVSGETQPASCSQVPSALPNGTHSGLDGAVSLVPSADGRALYVAADDDDSLAAFAREPDTTAPNLQLSGKTTQRSFRRVVTKASVDEDAEVRVKQKGKKVKVKGRSASASVKRKLKFEPITKDVTADSSRKFKLKPKGRRNKRKLKRLLRRGERVTVKLKGIATDDAGNKGRDGFRVSLKR
jgi:6-phosphogluconolactonase (cycloisomerase 2 family)